MKVYYSINLNYRMVPEMIELNILNIVQFIIITILIITLIYEIGEKIILYNSCNASLKKSESTKSKFHEFNEKANSTLLHLEKLNNLCKATYDSQEKIYTLSNKSSQTASSAGEYISSGSDSVEIALNILEDMKVSIESLTNYVGNLSEITVKVDEMAQLINKLSTDINLLSLNASIEAALDNKYYKFVAIAGKDCKGI